MYLCVSEWVCGLSPCVWLLFAELLKNKLLEINRVYLHTITERRLYAEVLHSHTHTHAHTQGESKVPPLFWCWQGGLGSFITIQTSVNNAQKDKRGFIWRAKQDTMTLRGFPVRITGCTGFTVTFHTHLIITGIGLLQGQMLVLHSLCLLAFVSTVSSQQKDCGKFACSHPVNHSPKAWVCWPTRDCIRECASE